MIFIFGSARSGSTWLGKIFDSHPELLYLHEPDIPDRGSDLLPHWFEREPTSQEIENARTYLNRLTVARNARTIGIRPFFHKRYRGPVEEVARLSLIYTMKFLERTGLTRVTGDIEIPDLALRQSPAQIVIKSVSALGRAEVLLAADRSISPVLLIRHPCGFVDSMLRGKQKGGMSKTTGLGPLARSRSARRLGLNSAALANSDEVALLAWTWLLSNAEALPVIQQANGTSLVYEDLATDPVRQVKDLFSRLGLGWPSETAAFLQESQETEGDYYSVFRDPQKALKRWREELDERTIDKIRGIVARDRIGAQFFDTF